MRILKKFNVLHLLSLVALLAQPGSVLAAELNVRQAVSEALTDSPKILKARSSGEEASWKRVESYSGYLPSVGASGSYLLAKKYALTDVTFPGAPAATSIPQIIPTTNILFTAQLPLFDGFVSTSRYYAAKALESAAIDETDWAVFQVEREVELQFFKALAAQQLRQVAEQNLKTLEDHLKDTRLFKRAGVSTNYDVLRVEVQVSEARSEVLNTQDALAISRNRLAEALGRESEERELKGELPLLKPAVLSALDSKKSSERKDLTSLARKTEAFGLQESAAGRYWAPRVALFGQYQYYNNLNDSISDTAAFREAYQLGISVSMNLFDGLGSYARSKESVEQRVQTEKSLEIARLHARQDQELWRRKFLYYCSVFEARQDDVQKSRESVRLAREGRKAGTRTNTDLLDAELELFRASAGEVNSRIGAIESLINLELATGQQLTQFNP